MSTSNRKVITRDLCKKCFISLEKPTRKEIKLIVMTESNEVCENCGHIGPVVDGIAEED